MLGKSTRRQRFGLLACPAIASNPIRDLRKNTTCPFSLISDESGAWAQAFGVKSTLGFHSRKSFLIDKSGKVAVIYPDVDPAQHAFVVLRDVTKLEGSP